MRISRRSFLILRLFFVGVDDSRRRRKRKTAEV
jgi:hypothetical protein